MTATGSLYNFFSGFGIPAYPSNAVPDDTTFPWLTYDVATGFFGDGDIPITVNLWYHTESEADPNRKAAEIAEAVGFNGALITCDTGAIWIKRSAPFCQNLADENDPLIKRRLINLALEYLTV